MGDESCLDEMEQLSFGINGSAKRILFTALVYLTKSNPPAITNTSETKEPLLAV